MKSIKCSCGRIAKYKLDLRFNGNKIDGWRCNSCEEEYYNPQKAEKILMLNKLRKESFDLKLNKIRSNLIIRIPAKISSSLDFHNGDKVELKLTKNNEIVIRAKN